MTRAGMTVIRNVQHISAHGRYALHWHVSRVSPRFWQSPATTLQLWPHSLATLFPAHFCTVCLTKSISEAYYAEQP